MRILRVAQKVYPDVKGGGPYHVHAMSRDQAALGHDVTVLTVRADPELPSVEERDGYTVRRFDPTVTLLGNDVSVGLARYLKNATDVDVIHAHSHLYFSTNLAAMKRRLGNVPLAITNHGLYSQTAPEWVFRWYLKTIGRWTYNQADVIFCYTDVDKERLREFGVKSEIEVVPNGVDTERFTPDGPKSELIDSDGPVVLFVGRLVEGKRPQVALEAVEMVREEYPDVRLYFCGEGPLRDELEERAGAGVEFLGHVPYDEMPRVYRSADVMVLPSRAEGVPRTVLEAQASGISVVVSDLPQIGNAITSPHSIVTGGTSLKFGKAILHFLDGDEPKHPVVKHSWEDTFRETTTALKGTIENRDDDIRASSNQYRNH